MAWWRGVGLSLAALPCLCVMACGGGSGGAGSTSRAAQPSAPAPNAPAPNAGNVANVIVDEGPSNNSVNALFTSVTVCVPGTTECQSIDHILVDTGSYGLRILAAALNLTLPVQTLANGESLAECTVFVDGYSWGPVELADLQMGGETANSVPFQAIGDSRFANVPADCSDMAKSEEDTVQAFGANGVLGIGPFASDCPNCTNILIPGTYYACSTAATCEGTLVPAASLVPNPVTRFAVDNNGSIIQLPSVTAGGQLTVNGTLTFGVDTQSNNKSGSETVLTVDDNAELTLTFNGQSLNQSFIDSGSNGVFFNDAAITVCAQSGYSDFYCPASTLNLAVSLQGQNGVTNNVDFGVGNAETMLANNPTFNAFPQLAGPNPNQDSFDLGLEFFYGRRVAIVVEGNTTAVGTGPYIAF